MAEGGPVNVAANFAVRTGTAPKKANKRRRKRRKRYLIQSLWVGGEVLETGHTAVVGVDVWKHVLVEAAKEGGSAFLKAMFARGILKKRKGKAKKGATSSLWIGWKGRTYRLTKLGGGKFRVERLK